MKVHYSLRYLDNDGEDLPQSQIEFKEVKGFQAHPKYWSVSGQSDHEGGLRGLVQYPPDRRNVEKDCYVRITALVKQSCIGTLRIEGKYRIDGGHRFSVKSEAKLTIEINKSASHTGGSQPE